MQNISKSKTRGHQRANEKVSSDQIQIHSQNFGPHFITITAQPYSRTCAEWLSCFYLHLFPFHVHLYLSHFRFSHIVNRFSLFQSRSQFIYAWKPRFLIHSNISLNKIVNQLNSSTEGKKTRLDPFNDTNWLLNDSNSNPYAAMWWRQRQRQWQWQTFCRKKLKTQLEPVLGWIWRMELKFSYSISFSVTPLSLFAFG